MMKQFRQSYFYLIFTLLCTAFSTGAFAQDNGRIFGRLVDKKTGEELIGVSIQIEGTSTGTSTDFEGKYNLSAAPGTYNLIFSYVSYSKKVIKGVEVKAKENTMINVSMEESTKELSEVVIQTEAKKESANALLIQQKNSVSVSSGVSADLIRRTPDRTTADVIKRISGASVQDNKFAIVRGLSDRYNMGYLNGAPLPSTESDRKAFSLDIIPASVIDNMQIIKGGTPDMPGDFAGGIIQVNTKDIPDENSFTIQMGGQYHSMTTFKEGLMSNTTPFNALGINNGKLDIPAIGTTEENRNLPFTKSIEQTNKFNNNYAPSEISSFRPNLSLQMSASRRFKLFKNDMGVVGAVNYSNSYRATPFSTVEPYLGDGTITSFDTSKSEGKFYNNESYKNSVSTGGILNLSYKIGKSSKLSLKNLYTVNAENLAVHRTGMNYVVGQGREQQIYSNDYLYQAQMSRMLSSQLNGEHLISDLKIKLKYTGSYTDIKREMPDFKRILYTAAKTVGDTAFGTQQAVVASNAGAFDPSQSGKYFSDLDEKMYSGGYDVTVPVKVAKIKKFDIKAGGLHTRRNRAFNARNFVHSQDDNQYDFGRGDSIKTLTPDLVFAPSNTDSATSFLVESTLGSDKYDASTKVDAGFLMVDVKPLNRLRVITGVRVEHSVQRLNSEAQGAPVKVDTAITDILPSVNIIYELTDKTNLRLGYAKTVSRPEFREFAPAAFYDINMNAVVTGNPSLIRAEVHNFDVKLEYFPTAGQVFSINPFFKRFIHPIEQTLLVGTTRNFTFRNGSTATNYGIEFEGRVNLGFISKENKILNNMFVFANYTWIRSEVQLETTAADTGRGVVKKRPLQGQSPFVFNAGVQYVDAKRKFDVSLTANQIGRRLAFVAVTKEYLVWENPRLVFDASVSKTFFDKLQVKITLGDILAQPLVFYNDLNDNEKFDEGSDVEFTKYKLGYTAQLSIGYTF